MEDFINNTIGVGNALLFIIIWLIIGMVVSWKLFWSDYRSTYSNDCGTEMWFTWPYHLIIHMRNKETKN